MDLGLAFEPYTSKLYVAHGPVRARKAGVCLIDSKVGVRRGNALVPWKTSIARPKSSKMRSRASCKAAIARAMVVRAMVSRSGLDCRRYFFNGTP